MSLQEEEKKQEILKLLQRIDTIYRSRPRSDDELLKAAREWYNHIGFCNFKQLNEALTIYIREDSGSNRFAPKPGELLKIYNDMRKEEQDNKSWDTAGLCSLCYGNGWALVDLPEEKDYNSFGIRCPCKSTGEITSLRNGSRLTRKLAKKNKQGQKYYWGKLTYWLENERLKGTLEIPQKKLVTEVEPEPIQQSFSEPEPWIADTFDSFDSIDNFDELPPDWLPF